MSQIHQEIVSSTSGFSFRLVVEVEQRIATGAKYPDKVTKKAELGGHADTYEEACEFIKNARMTIRELFDKVPKKEATEAQES